MSLLSAPDPPLVGETVALRQFRPADAVAVSQACQDPDIPRSTFMAKDLTVEQARTWIDWGLEGWANGVARFAVTLPPDDVCVGQVGAGFDFEAKRVEVFYWIERGVRGRGVASEALELVTNWAFGSFDIVRAQLVTDPDNVASQRVAERGGYRREGLLRGWEPWRPGREDVVMFARLRTDDA